MRLAFILPSESDRQIIERCRVDIKALRPDQLDYAMHLVRSWMGRRGLGIGDVRRALRKAKEQRP